MSDSRLEVLLRGVAAEDSQPVYLFVGDLVAIEPQAARLAQALAEQIGCRASIERRPPRLDAVFADLRTGSLFDPGKVVTAVDTAVLADVRQAADLIDQAAEQASAGDADGPLDGPRREAASRLVQALRLFGVDPAAGEASRALDELPTWALQGGSGYRRTKPRGRGKKQVATVREELVPLLDAARRAGLQGHAEDDLAGLAQLIDGGMPAHHHLILVERSAAAQHPVVAALGAAGAVLEVETIEATKSGEWQGLAGLVEELERETGVGLGPSARRLLAERTLRQGKDFRDKRARGESTARFAGEYRKLAALARGRGARSIDAELVVETVKDRGEEDVWQILDAVGAGRAGEAVARYRRLIEAADQPMQARLSFFALLAGFCRHLTAVAGMARLAGVPAGVRSYGTFKSRWAPALQAESPSGGKNPLAGLHPFRLHKAYLAASALDRQVVARLPWRVLETELQIKGEVSDPDVAVAGLLAHLATARRGDARRGDARRGDARRGDARRGDARGR